MKNFFNNLMKAIVMSIIFGIMYSFFEESLSIVEMILLVIGLTVAFVVEEKLFIENRIIKILIFGLALTIFSITPYFLIKKYNIALTEYGFDFRALKIVKILRD